MSIRRSRVFDADGVDIVASTRCPVSAAVSAISTVSRSRSSPITITSGSSRKDALSAAAKLRVCAPTSRCEITDFLRGCRISTGSSIVRTWWALLLLIRSTSAASVVVLPWPLGPAITTSPW